MSHASRIFQVAVPVPLHQTYDYLAPEALSQALPGVRVRVPFGRRSAVGILLAITDQSDVPKSRLKRVEDVLDDFPLLPESLFKLLQWAAGYYHHPLGEVLQAAMPLLLRQGRPAMAAGTPVWRLTAVGAAAEPSKFARAPLQRRIFQALRDATVLREPQLRALSPRWSPVMKVLCEQGVAVAEELLCLEVPAPASDLPRALTDAQKSTSDVIRQANAFRCFLLHGVTGSGKTEVYLCAIDDVLARGQQALVLVPEIGLTPQLVDRFRRRFSVPIVILHSGLTEQERLCAWLSAGNGSAAIVIGTRSAVFVPLAKPGLIVVDEEHDGSYKQQDGFRYHARDVAVMRASRENVPIVLGSATPSLESLKHARAGSYTLLALPERVGAAGMPTVRLLDMRRLNADGGLSNPLREAIAQRLARGEQVLLFLNRRGFAPAWMCYSCDWIASCARCDARLTVHRRSRKLRCHHCGGEQPIVEKCPSCAAALHALGEGTERVEDTLEKYFASAHIERIDRDSTRRKGALEQKLDRVRSGEPCILVGTQMLSKGHDFPNVTLVGVLDADQGLYNVDFRAPERLFQQIMQVSGRAGRADKPGEVLIQTWHPEHPIFETLARHDFASFADYALSERHDAAYPPYRHLVLLRAEAVSAGLAMSFLSHAHAAAQDLTSDAIEVLDPAPAPMERRAGRYRAQLLVQSFDRKRLHAFLDTWISRLMDLKPARQVRWSLDVDPMEMY